MASKIDYTYFWGTTFIPLLDEESSAADDIKAELDKYIAKYEKKFIADLFGIEETENNTALFALLADSETLTSPIANYVYFFYKRQHATTSTNAGEKTNKSDQSSNASPNQKLCEAWNEIPDMCLSILKSAIGLGYSLPDDLTYLYIYLNVNAPVYDETKVLATNYNSDIWDTLNEFGI